MGNPFKRGDVVTPDSLREAYVPGISGRGAYMVADVAGDNEFSLYDDYGVLRWRNVAHYRLVSASKAVPEEDKALKWLKAAVRDLADTIPGEETFRQGYQVAVHEMLGEVYGLTPKAELTFVTETPDAV